MLRALARFLGTGVPVIGVNYGRVGFLTAIAADELEAGVDARVRRRLPHRRARDARGDGRRRDDAWPSTTWSSRAGRSGA